MYGFEVGEQGEDEDHVQQLGSPIWEPLVGLRPPQGEGGRLSPEIDNSKWGLAHTRLHPTAIDPDVVGAEMKEVLVSARMNRPAQSR